MRKPPVVILAGVRWDFLWQRHQTLATRFALAGYDTCFVETTGLANPSPTPATLRKFLSRLGRSGIRSSKPRGKQGLTVYAPLVAPPTLRSFRWANREVLLPRVVRDLRKMAGPHPVVLAYPPTRTTLGLISGLEPRLVLYDCADDYEHFPGAPGDIGSTERELLRRADLVSCTSTGLLEKVRPLRPDAFLSGPAVDYERFTILQVTRPVEEVRTVCFFGHVNRERIDLPVLRAIAGAGYVVRIVGDLGRVDRTFLRTPGVDYRGEASHEELPAALSGVDAFVLPYRPGALSRSISPAKTYECLATGRPVVAAPLPAMEDLAGHVYLARSPEDYVKTLGHLAGTETEERVRARIELSSANSWDARFAELEEALWRFL
ncbi:MAG: glycosyltransferase family protein [Rubrobacter sp.]